MDTLQQKTLAWVNETRFHGCSLPPLEHLPKGKRGDAFCCIIANCFPKELFPLTDGTMLYFDPSLADVLHANGFEMPEYVREFIDNFDRGDYPELDIEASRRSAGFLLSSND